MPDNPALVMESLVVVRDERALFSPLDFRLRRGDLYQVVGPNGQGKTTLLRTLAGVYTQCHGLFCWADDALPAYLGHKSGLHPSFTLIENMRQLFGVYELSFDQIDRILLSLGLMGAEDTVTSRLSAGQTRKIALSPLLHTDMRFRHWLLDEPFTALDRGTCELIEALIDQHTLEGQCVIFTSHQSLVSQPLRARVREIALEVSNQAVEAK